MGGCPRCGAASPNPACGRCGAACATADPVGDRSHATHGAVGTPAQRSAQEARGQGARRHPELARQRSEPRRVSPATEQADEPAGRLEYLRSLQAGVASLRGEAPSLSSRTQAQPRGNSARGRSAGVALLEGALEIQASISGLSERSRERNTVLRHMLEQQRSAATVAMRSQLPSGRGGPPGTSEPAFHSRPVSGRRPSSARRAAVPEAYHRARSPSSGTVDGAPTMDAAAPSLAIQGQQHSAQRLLAQQAAEAEERRLAVQAFLAAQETAENMFSRISGVAAPQLNAAEAEALAALTLSETTAVVANRQEDACAICLDAMTVGENVRMLGCGHRFHQPCLRKWLHGKGECVCPMCRVRSQPAGKARAQA
eukprot:jgi/Tetstr1/443038/TSEL_031097.t1